MMILWAAAVAVALGIGGYFAGRHDGRELEAATQLREDARDAATLAAAQRGAAKAIAGIKPRNVTIRQEVQREIQTNTRYVSADCALTDGVRLRVDEALTGRATVSPSADRVPGTVAPER